MATLSTSETSSIVSSKVNQPRRRWSRYSNRTFYLFISPWVLGFLCLTVIPFIYALLVSFSNFDGISIWHWTGLKNYTDIVKDTDAFYSLSRTLLYTAIMVPLQILGGLGLALLLDRKIWGISFFRTIFYLPAVVPAVAAAITWRSVLARDTGILNAVIEHLGGTGLTWLEDPTAFSALLMMGLWGMGGSMIISLAALQGVPTELREAAKVDGANGWHVLRHIILPLLTPVLFFQIVMGCIGTLQTLVEPLLLSETSGISQGWNIPHGNYLFMIHVYEQFLFFQRFGYGSALLWVLFLVILLITYLVFRSSLFWVYYEVDREKGQ